MKPRERDPALREWQARALYAVLLIIAASGLPAYLLPILNAVRLRQPLGLMWIYAGAYLAFVVLAFLPRLSVRLRTGLMLLFAYANAFASFARLGLSGSGRLYLLVMPLFVTLVVGALPGAFTAAASVALYAACAALVRAGLLARWSIGAAAQLPFSYWVEAGAALAVFLATTLVLVQRFIRLHVRTLEQSRRTAADLERTARTLREREERLGIVVQGTNDGIWDWDLATDEVYYSPRWKSMLGYAEDEVPDRFSSWRELVHPEDIERALAEVRACREGGKNSYEVEHRLRHKDGSWRWILARGGLVRDERGEARRLVGTHTDITERKRAVAELEAAYQGLEQRVRERTRELAVLNATAAVVSRSLDLGEIMSAGLEKAMEVAGTEGGGAYRLEGNGLLVMMAHRGLSEDFTRFMARLPLETALAGQPLRLDRPLAWPIAEYPEGVMKKAIRREGLELVIGVPLLAKGRTLGALVLSTRARREISPEESALLIAVGQQIGLAMENARLYEAERLGHEEAERREAVAEGMRETLAVLNSRQSLQETLEFIVHQTCRVLSSDAASLLELDPEDERLRIRCACGLDPAFAAQVRLPLGRGGAGRALQQRAPQPIPDVAAEARRLSALGGLAAMEERAGMERLLALGFRSLLAVPLVVQGEGYGAIVLYFRRTRIFSEEEIRLAASVADQAALAVENARLRSRAEQAATFAERSRLARELHDSVTQSLYSVTLYAAAAARLLAGGDTATAAGHLQELRGTAQEALREMRLLIFQLSPPALDQKDLAAALQTRLDAVEERGGLPVDYRVEGTDHLAPAVRQELYSIAQEALNNALKHAHAGRVSILLRFEGEGARLEVGDDGRGFEPDQGREGGGLGLRGMQERACRIGASLRVESSPGGGTRVVVETGGS